MQNKLKVFQLYFREDQRPFLIKEFTPFDNTANPAPNDREYPLLLKCRELAKQQGVELWGAVPWNYDIKMGEPPSEIFSFIERNPGYDAYFLNCFTDHAAVVYNVWEQGQWCHPHLVEIVETIFPMIGLNKDIIYQPTDRHSIFWGSMIIANEKFWNAYFSLGEKFVRAVKNLPPHIYQMYKGNTGYAPDITIDYFSFIQERLLSTFVALNRRNFKILPYHLQEDNMTEMLYNLSSLKTLGLERRDWRILHKWIYGRNMILKNIYPNVETPDLASHWLQKFNPEIM